MTQRYQVVGIGNAIVDVLSRTEDATVEKHGLVKGSMTLIDLRQGLLGFLKIEGCRLGVFPMRLRYAFTLFGNFLRLLCP